SGKTITALSLLGLLPPGGRMSGHIRFGGQDLLTLRPREMADVRGRDIAMVFQDPMTALHPMLSIEKQLTEHLRHHRGIDARAARTRAIELLELVRIPDAARALKRYPHQFSGGMRQRIAIAIALCCEPRLLIADEPTTALDVTVQAGILRLLQQLRGELGLSVLLITHDMGVMSALSDRVVIMYAGRVVETGTRTDVLQRPRHPYTHSLLGALPHEQGDDMLLQPMRGTPPSIGALPPGCPFHPRCDWAEGRCRDIEPGLRVVEADRGIACVVDPLVGVPA
ncbi:ABC transporter ATP-binding protein, partial [Ralstonia sp.]|uniref:ABC transporter ATP-binding protein n=1 Tax=Ralstonia sp. TaxID=54061 RepID=UPI00257E01B2